MRSNYFRNLSPGNVNESVGHSVAVCLQWYFLGGLSSSCEDFSLICFACMSAVVGHLYPFVSLPHLLCPFVGNNLQAFFISFIYNQIPRNRNSREYNFSIFLPFSSGRYHVIDCKCLAESNVSFSPHMWFPWFSKTLILFY